MFQQLKSGMDVDEQETIEELLQGAQQRVLAAIPSEVQAVLQQLPPQLLESYALLQQIPVHGGQEQTDQPFVPQHKKSSVIAPPVRSLTSGDLTVDGMTMEITADTPEEMAFLQGLSGLVNSGLAQNQVRPGESLHAPTPTTFTMQADVFQGTYKGYVEVSEGKGRKATKETRVLAVHKAVYEAEREGAGDAVKQPAYWLSRHNAMTVYFPGQEYEIEAAWLLGDYDPQTSGIPAGLRPTPEQIVQWMQEPDDEATEVEVIKRLLCTPEQQQWLHANGVTISEVLNGRVPSTLDVERVLFEDWNAKLGVKLFSF